MAGSVASVALGSHVSSRGGHPVGAELPRAVHSCLEPTPPLEGCARGRTGGQPVAPAHAALAMGLGTDSP